MCRRWNTVTGISCKFERSFRPLVDLKLAAERCAKQDMVAKALGDGRVEEQIKPRIRIAILLHSKLDRALFYWSSLNFAERCGG